MPKGPLPPILTRPPVRGHWAAVLKDGPAQLALAGPAAKPTVDERAMSVTAVLSTDTPDRQGDIVVPAGVDTAEHRVNPVVMFHHGKDHKLPIGKAEDKNGRYTVRVVNGRLVGTTHFAQDDPVAEQVFNLVKQDVLRGVSIGFDPVPGHFEPLGEAPDEGSRPPLRFDKAVLLEYSHTPIGVNRDALTLAVRKAEDGSRPLHPAILKALTPYAAPKAVAVRGGWHQPRQVKAMDDQYDDDVPAAPGDETETDLPAEEPAAGPSPTVKAMYDLAQGLLDLADQTEDALSQGEHVKGKKYALKVLDGIRADADACKAMGDKIASELGGDTPADDTDDDVTPEPVETGEDGAIVTKGYSPRRWTYADLLRAKPEPKPAGDDPEEVKALEKRLAKLKLYEERGRRYAATR